MAYAKKRMGENAETLPGQPDLSRARTTAVPGFAPVFGNAVAQPFGQTIMQPFNGFPAMMPPVVVDPSIWANNMTVLPMAQTAVNVHPGMDGKPIICLSYYGDYTIPTYVVEAPPCSQAPNAARAPVSPKPEEKESAKAVEKRKCTKENCKKKAVDGTDLCYAHSGRMRCRQEGCTRAARGCYKFCRAHGGGPRCTYPDCTKSAIDASRLCRGHGGGPRCQHEGCKKSAAGAPPIFCISHGGGRRCTVQGCTKSAQRATKRCIAHGGGKRCVYPGCSKSAQGGTDLCKSHGGGKRCQFPKCPKTATTPKGFCKFHFSQITLS